MTGTIHLQLLQDDNIIFQLPSQGLDSHETCLQKLKLCGLVGRFITCHTGLMDIKAYQYDICEVYVCCKIKLFRELPMLMPCPWQ